MPLNPNKLAGELKSALGQSAASPQIVGMASAIVAHCMTGIVSFLPATVNGTSPPGGPLSGGEAKGGLIVLVPPALEAALIAVFGQPTPQISGMANSISAHIMTGLVEFQAGGITGVCGNTPVSPGPLVGQGADGKITGLDPGMLGKAISAFMGGTVSPELEKMCKAVVEHVSKEGSVSFLPGTITGLCPPAGGPITLGAGVGGVIM